MAHLDVFQDTAFEMAELTEAINMVPHQPAYLKDLGLFQSRPIRTLKATIEEKNNTLALISTAGRGTTKDVRSRPTRNLRDFRVPHVPYFAEVLADDVQSIRAFGSETELEAVMDVVNDVFVDMRVDHEATQEWHRIGAIQGQVLDADATTVIFNYFTEFGLSETNITFDMGAGNADMKLLAQQVTRTMSTNLGMTPFNRIVAICGDRFFDALINHATVASGYERWQGSLFFRTTQLGPSYNADMSGFEFGNITWVNYRGQVGDVTFIADDVCRFVPIGVPGLFLEVLAPADFMDTVNTRGKEFYASREFLPHNKGVELHTQSNILYIPTRPGALIKGTATNIPAIVPAMTGEQAIVSQIAHSARPGDKVIVTSGGPVAEAESKGGMKIKPE